MCPSQSLLAIFQGALSTVAHYSSSSILLCAAVLSCSAQELAAVPSNEVCSPENPVLFRLVPLVPGTTSRSWTGLYCNLLACHPWAAPNRAPMDTPWRQLGCFSPSVSEQKHQAPQNVLHENFRQIIIMHQLYWMKESQVSFYFSCA